MELKLNLIVALTFLFSSFLALFCFKKIQLLFEQDFSMRLNYRGIKISLSGPSFFVMFFLAACFGALFSFFFDHSLDYSVFYASLFLLSLLLLAGLLDDLFGTRDARGFKGHFGSLLKGRLTTGFLKALLIFVASATFSAFFSNSLVVLILNALLISLLANFLNLLDLKPGRAGKTFLFLAFFAWLSLYKSSLRPDIASVGWLLWASFLPPLVSILWYDLKEKLMLGDSGSNLLGGFLGIFFCLTIFDWRAKLGLVILLVLLHLVAEFSSFSYFFENFAFLKFFDNLGRLKEKKFE